MTKGRSQRFLPMLAAFAAACIAAAVFAERGPERTQLSKENQRVTETESIVLGGGCFWCIEAIFQGFKGIRKVESGYAGGSARQANYEAVSSGATNHAEVVRVEFDAKVISLDQLLTIFFHAHDPTTLNRQGNDVGPQYRSVIFHQSPEQETVARRIRERIVQERIWGDKALVTEISALDTFHRAEDYHQNYYANNPSKGYCSIVIAPKVQKIRKEFAELLDR